MKLAWKSLLILGVLLILIAFSMDTTVSGLGGQRYHNIGLQGQQQMLLILGGVMFLAGIVLFAVVKIKQTPEQEAQEAAGRARQLQKGKDGLNTAGRLGIGVVSSLQRTIDFAWSKVRRSHVLIATAIVTGLTLLMPPHLVTDYINGGIKFEFVMRLPIWAKDEIMIGRLIAELLVEALIGGVAFVFAKK